MSLLRRLVVSWALLTLLVTAAPLAAAPADATIRLAEDGRALQPIVISADASDDTRAVADELAEHLEKMTGAAFEVTTGDGSRGIVLGTLAQFPDPALDAPLEQRGFDGKEAFVIRTEPDRLRLIGATELGASHAAFALLEELGCRWFFQAPEWTVVPSTPALSASVHRDDRPVILARRIWYGYGFFDHSPKSRVIRDYNAWARHNRMAQSFTINCGHAYQTIISDNEEAFAAHPEYRALVDGKRQGEQLCISNKGLRQLATDWALEQLRKRPELDMVSMEPSDGGGHCECEECAKIGKVSDRVFTLANHVAREVAREHPGKMVGLYAYNEHSQPPTFELEPNVYVQLTAGFTRGQYTFDELMELWPRKSKNMGFYEYFSVWLWDFDRLPGGRGGNIGYLREQIPRYVAQNATSLDCESGDNWGPHGRGYYIANKLMWDPEADVDAMLTDFYEKAFGPGAEAMRRYYERFDPSNEPLMSEHLLALGFRDIEEASRVTAELPGVQARLDQLKRYLHYVHLRWLLDREQDAAKKKELTLAALTHVYRARHDYMNHWEAMRQDWTVRAAKDFDEPTWAFNEPTTPKPWANDTPYTHEETEALFQKGLAHFQPQEVTERTFSDNLVPVAFEGAQPAEGSQAYQGSVTYALYSVGGDPLKFGILTGVIAHYRDRAATQYTVCDAEGKTVGEGRLPLDGEVHAVEVAVPAAGLYRLVVDDFGAGWGLKSEAGVPVSIELQRGRQYVHLGHMQPMYFYVPKGTKELHYFWSGGPHHVHGPDGTKITEVTTSGGFVKLAVPEGADGKPWHFRHFALGHLWFFNAPNVLAPSAASLLLPAELVEEDGLSRREGK